MGFDGIGATCSGCSACRRKNMSKQTRRKNMSKQTMSKQTFSQ
jgi:hypothetical protein